MTVNKYLVDDVESLIDYRRAFYEYVDVMCEDVVESVCVAQLVLNRIGTRGSGVDEGDVGCGVGGVVWTDSGVIVVYSNYVTMSGVSVLLDDYGTDEDRIEEFLRFELGDGLSGDGYVVGDVIDEVLGELRVGYDADKEDELFGMAEY